MKSRDNSKRENKWFRVDGHKDIIIKGKIKVTKGSWIVIALTAVFLYAVVSSYFTTDYEFIHWSCDDYMKKAEDFKTNNLTMTPEEQEVFERNWKSCIGKSKKEQANDFMPPSGFLIPYAYAGEYEFSPERLPIDQVDSTLQLVNKDITQMRIDIDSTKADIRAKDKALVDMEKDLIKQESTLDTIRTSIKNLKVRVEISKENLKINTALSPQNLDEIEQQTKIRTAHTNLLKLYDAELAKKTTQADLIVKVKLDIDALKKELKTLAVKLYTLETEYKIKKINSANKNNKKKFITISLSTTCVSMIDAGKRTDCPTIKFLKENFDNANSVLFGKFAQGGDDIYREKSVYNEYWRYYDNSKEFTITIVDPNKEMLTRSSNITIMPSDFEFLTKDDTSSKQTSINVVKNERYIWSGVKMYDNCKHALTSPLLEHIKFAHKQILNNCADLPIEQVIKLPSTKYLTTDSPSYQTQQYWKSMANKCKGKCGNTQ